MATYDYVPTHFDGVSLTASPFTKCWFMVPNSPVSGGRRLRSIEADVIGIGPQDVRAQPRSSTWTLHVLLSGDTVALEKSMKEVFSHDRGLSFLRANDGDGTSWRVECRVQTVDRVPGNTRYWLVTLRVPDPLWETNTLVTDNDLNNSGDSTSDTITNAGNVKAFPIFKLTIDSQKARDPEQDFMHAIRGYIVNRSPGVWSDLPVELTDANNTHSGWDTAALISNDAESGTANGTVNSTATSMTLNGGHGFSDGPQFFHNVSTAEQFYGVLATNAISNMVRGIGGTAAQSISNANTIRRSDMLGNMNDVRIWLNGRQVERWTAAPATSASKIWVNMTMPPAVKLTASALGTTSVPADGGEIRFDEGVEGLPESGVLWNAGDSTPNRELIAYSARDIPGQKVTGIQRDVWVGSAPGTAWAKGDVFYLVSALYVIQFGRTEGTGSTGSFSNPLSPPPEPADRRPAIQLKSSLNPRWRWGDQADDSLTVFHDKNNPNRTAQFRPDYHVAPEDNNVATPLQVVDSSDILQWKDADPAAGKLAVGRMTLHLPQGIEAVSNGITYDVVRRPAARLRILGRDADGFEVELVDEWTEDDSEAAATAQTITPASTLRDLTLQGVRAAVSGSPRYADATYFQFNTVTDFYQAQFVLDVDTEIESFLMRLWKSGSPTTKFDATILEDNSGSPGSDLLKLVNWSVNSTEKDFPVTNLGTTASHIVAFFNDDGSNKVPFILLAGTYWLEIRADGSGSMSGVNVLRIGAGALRAKNTKDAGTLDTINVDDMDFAYISIVHKGAGPVQAESEFFSDNTTPSFDKLILELNDNADPALDETPWVDRPSAAETDTYHVKGNWKNTTTGDEIDIDVWIDTGMELEIDTENKTVKLIEGNWVWTLPAVITPSNLKEWLPVQPGANTLTYTEQDMVNTDLVITHRGQKV